MAYDLAQLTEALRTGAAAQGTAATLAPQIKAAQGAVDTPTAQLRPQMGMYSVLSEIGNAMKRDRGQAELDTLQPRLQAAMQAQAEAKNAGTLYDAQRQADQTTYERSRNAAGDLIAADERKWERSADPRALKLAMDKLKQKRDLESGDITGTGKTYANPDGSEPVTVFNTQAGPVNERGEAVDLTGKVPYTAPTSGKSGSGGGGYTTDLNKLANKALITMTKADRVGGIGNALTQEDKAQLNSTGDRWKQILMRGFSPSGARALIGSDLSGFSPEVKNFVVAVSRLSAEERHELFGAALTQGEAESSEDFLARVRGLSLDEMMARMGDTYSSNAEVLRVADTLGGGDKYSTALGNLQHTNFGKTTEPKIRNWADM